MPELPEVEITRRGLAEHLVGATIKDAVIRNASLRWPIPKNLPKLLRGQTILSLQRRAKYLLADCGNGTLILHLGMSGSLRILPANTPPEKHDHFDLVFSQPPPVRAEPVEAHESIHLSAKPLVLSTVEGPERTDQEYDENMKIMRLRDPRRFGAVLWHSGDVYTHPLLATLGPEPLEEDSKFLPPCRGKARMGVEQRRGKTSTPSPTLMELPAIRLIGKAAKSLVVPLQGGGESGIFEFNARYLYQATRGRTISIKQCIMDNHVVVGVGNIYANEALFRAGIKPQLAAGKLSLPRCARLVEEIRATLCEAIKQGGSFLRDFVNTAGQPGYFQQNYSVYGRAGEPCHVCGSAIKQIKQGQRSSFYCGVCQK